MNFFSINSVANYVKTRELEFNWQKRKDNPTLKKGANEVKEDPQIAFFKKQWREQQKAQATAAVFAKLQAGAPLSADEMEYLKTHAPQEYEKAVQIANERKQYKRELENCKSKEDVEKLNQRKLSQFCTEASAISKNPNIPEEKKLERLQFIGMRMMAVMDEHYKFKKTEKYQKLPDRREDRKEKEIAVVSAAEEKKLDLKEVEAEDEDPLKKLGELLEGVFLPLEDDTPAKPAQPATDKAAAPPATTPAAHVYNSQGQKSEAAAAAEDISIDV